MENANNCFNDIFFRKCSNDNFKDSNVVVKLYWNFCR